MNKSYKPFDTSESELMKRERELMQLREKYGKGKEEKLPSPGEECKNLLNEFSYMVEYMETYRGLSRDVAINTLVGMLSKVTIK